MKVVQVSSIALALAIPFALMVGCGDDSQTSCADNPGGCTTASSSSASTSVGSSSSTGSGMGGAGGEAAGGAGGAGGGVVTNCVANPGAADVPATMFDAVNDEYEIKTNVTLTSDKIWSLKHKVHVRAGATITIEPCTTIQGDNSTKGTLIIDPGAKIIAEGLQNEPIVFTSAAPVGQRQAGDWGGLILLGRAPINVPGGKANIEGLNPTPETQYGGDAPNDDSGSLKYIRIEFSDVLKLYNEFYV